MVFLDWIKGGKREDTKKVSRVIDGKNIKVEDVYWKLILMRRGWRDTIFDKLVDEFLTFYNKRGVLPDAGLQNIKNNLNNLIEPVGDSTILSVTRYFNPNEKPENAELENKAKKDFQEILKKKYPGTTLSNSLNFDLTEDEVGDEPDYNNILTNLTSYVSKVAVNVYENMPTEYEGLLDKSMLNMLPGPFHTILKFHLVVDKDHKKTIIRVEKFMDLVNKTAKLGYLDLKILEGYLKEKREEGRRIEKTKGIKTRLLLTITVAGFRISHGPSELPENFISQAKKLLNASYSLTLTTDTLQYVNYDCWLGEVVGKI